MFTAAEYRLIREHGYGELQKLFAKLGIAEPNWNAGGEFKIYEKIDDEIISRLCQLMKSESIIDGYTKLLKFGGVHFDYNETDNELLGKIVQSQDAVIRGATQVQEIPAEPTAPPPPSKTKKVVRKRVLIPALIILGAILVVLGIVNIFHTLPEIFILLGIISAIFGVRGRTIEQTVEVKSAPAPQVRQVQTLPAPFSRAEIQAALDALSQTLKVVRSI